MPVSVRYVCMKRSEKQANASNLRQYAFKLLCHPLPAIGGAMKCLFRANAGLLKMDMSTPIPIFPQGPSDRIFFTETRPRIGETIRFLDDEHFPFHDAIPACCRLHAQCKLVSNDGLK